MLNHAFVGRGNVTFESFAIGDLAFGICLETGALRGATFRGEEVVRGVYVALRDEHWGTADVFVDGFQRTESSASWIQVTSAPGRKMVWECAVTADSQGFEFRGRGIVWGDLETRRAGLCLLHAPSMAGTACVVESPNGARVRDEFPKHVKHRQPFWNVAAFEWMQGDLPVRVDFEGETFETEDQRNWGDASYKTYCRPHAWPQPYSLKDGEVVEHAVRVRIAAPAIAPTGLRIGTMLGGPEPLADWQIERLRGLNLGHLGTSAEPSVLREAARVARALGVPLQVHARGPLLEEVPWRGENVCQVLVGLDDAMPATDAPVFRAAWENFTELNGQPPSMDGLAGVAFGMNPQVHAFDARSIMEIPPMVGFLADEAWSLAQGKEVVVAPIAFERGGRTGDPRFRGSLAGEWTAAAIASLRRSKASRATFFATHGAGGILTDDPEVELPVERALRG